MYTPRNGWFASCENCDDQCGFGIYLTYVADENSIVFGIQFLTVQIVLGYDFSPYEF